MQRQVTPDPVAISSEIVGQVAEREGVKATDLDPLFYSVDTDALDRLLEHENGEGPVHIEFTYCGYDIHVSSDGTVRVRS